MLNSKKTLCFFKRKKRVRFQIKQKAKQRLRLSVFRSNHHIYAQIIDDRCGKTLIAASSLEADLRSQKKYGNNRVCAEIVGKKLAERAQSTGIRQVVFDRGGYRYHGRIRALADSARSGGIDF